MSGEKRKGIILQVAILFALAIVASGIITFVTQHLRANQSVKQQAENHSAEIANEVSLAVREYPGYRWLLRYWLEHWDSMDVEYDVDFSGETETEAKYRSFHRRNPGLQLRYMEEEQIEALSEEDQKLYAEICYSWLITRVDTIKQTHKVDYLFCVVILYLLHIIGGVDRPGSGNVYINDTDLHSLTEDALAVFRRRNIGLIYQFYNLIPVLNIDENIILPSLLDGLANGLGYSIILLTVGTVREIFGSGTWFGLTIFPLAKDGGWYVPNGLLVLPPSGFFLIGLFIWAVRSSKRYAKQVEPAQFEIVKE